MSEIDSDGSDLFSWYKYKCSYAGCSLQFRRKDRLDSHEYTHSQVKKYQCPEPNCDKAYINTSHLQRHQRTAHSTSKKIVCCSYDECGTFFDSDAKLKAHCRSVHMEKSRAFECDICNAKFRRKLQLKQHMFKHTGYYRFTCDVCNKGFLLLSRLKRHQKWHKTRKCEQCDATFEKWTLFLAHKRTEHNNLKCPTCDKEFPSRRSLKNHRKTHINLDDRNVFQCTFDGCTKFFFERKNMLAHYKTKHENRKFICSFENCQLELSTKQKLELHMKVVHLGESGQKKSKTEKQVNRAKRKDAGVPKRSTASKLFNVVLPPAFEQAIISGHGNRIHVNYDGSNMEKNDQVDSLDLNVGQSNGIYHMKEGVVQC